ncbi:MAG TPA: prepilin peptidase [Candidatus Paceibacterota bacterium]|nr:prepilin peptidase [Candidatus Paceibacterota bacterium]
MDALQSSLLFPVAAAVLGAIFGSFINALSFRWGTGRSIANGRSKCMQCGHTLAASDLVPVFSYVFLGGRCRYCSARISVQYPLVELAGAGLSLLVFLSYSLPLAYAFWLLVWMILLFVVVYDLRHTVIPWSCSILLAILAFASLFISFSSPGHILDFVSPDIWAVLAGPLLALPLTLISLASRGRWMGWGDGALELSLGWFLGLAAGGSALMLAFWIGAAVGILLIVLKKGLTMRSELPFAPFLVLGALVALFFHVDFLSSLPLLF